MKIELTEEEVKAALDYWLRSVHATMMDAKSITALGFVAYPNRIELTIGVPQDGNETP